MPIVQATAKTVFPYDGIPRSVGEVFNCDLGHARMLKLIGKVEFDEAPTQAKTEPSTKQLKADGSPDRRYRRRDMQAED